MKTVAVIPAGKFQIPFIKFLRDKGLNVVSFDEDDLAPGHSFSYFHISEKFEESLKIIGILENSQIKLDGVISYCSDVGMILSAQLREHFGIGINQVYSARNVTRKDYQRSIWKESNISTPKFTLISAKDFNHREIRTIFGGEKIVVKPVDLAGSNGVTILDASSNDVEGRIRNAIHLSKVGIAIVEQYMYGDEYTVDGFMALTHAHVLLMTKKHKTLKGLPTVANILEAVDNNSDTVAKARNFIEESLLALGYSDGPFHCEIIMDKNEVVGMVEVAGRGGGSNLANKMIEVHSGQNYFEMSLSYAIGDVLEEQSHKNKPCIMYFLPSKSGKFHSFHVPEKILNLEMIKGFEYDLYIERNEFMGDPFNDGGRIGNLIFELNSFSDYKSLIQELDFDDWVKVEN